MKIEQNGDKYYLHLNGRRMKLHVNNDLDRSGTYFGCRYVIEESTRNGMTFEDIADIKVMDLPAHCCFNVQLENAAYEHLFNILIANLDDTILMRGNIAYEAIEWKHDLNPRTVLAGIMEYLGLNGFYKINDPYEESHHIIFNYVKKLDPFVTLREETDCICDIFGTIQDDLLSKFSGLTRVTAELNVPREYSHLFAQYLMYFGQFLADMNLPSETTVTTKARSVLLNINPRNRGEAIENIYAALRIYVAFIYDDSIIIQTSDPNAERKYDQLVANVRHLKAQLKLASATIDLKDEHINFLQNVKDVSPSGVVGTYGDVKSEVSEKWEPIDGFAFTKFKGKFFEIDIPKLIRKFGWRK